MPIDAGLAFLIRYLASSFTVPRFVVTEHVLQTGMCYIFKAAGDQKKWQAIRDHLVNDHLLNSGADDSEEILRIGEPVYPGKLLVHLKHILRVIRVYEDALNVAKGGGDLLLASARIVKCRKELHRLIAILPIWVEKIELESQLSVGDTENDKEA